MKNTQNKRKINIVECGTVDHIGKTFNKGKARFVKLKFPVIVEPFDSKASYNTYSKAWNAMLAKKLKCLRKVVKNKKNWAL